VTALSGPGRPAADASTYVVVGAGLTGAATAWRLAEAGHEVTVLERGRPADRGGSSHGSARIFRYSYPELFYTDLTRRSKALWDELEAVAVKSLISRTGCVDWGELRDPWTLARNLETAGVEHELLSPSDAGARWPMRFETPVLWHPDAGVIDAESAVTAMVGLAVTHGARLLTGWDVQSIERTGTGYRLHATTGQRMEADRVVLSAGGFLPRLLESCDLDPRFVEAMPTFRVTQEQALHFPYQAGAASWPTFIHKTREIQTYSLPGGRDADFRGQKLAEYAAGKPLRSAYDQDQALDPAQRARLSDYVDRFLPGLVPEPYAETTCLFTSTPTNDFVLDRADGITVLSPCSGHGAKFAPLVGVLGAHLASAGSAASGRAAVPEPFLVGSRSRLAADAQGAAS
jgi:sarcosine oxidase